MLIVSQWAIDETALKVYPQNQPHNPLPLSGTAIRALVYLSNNQHRMVTNDELTATIFSTEEPSQRQALLDEAITKIGHHMGIEAIQETNKSNYLLTLPIFNDQYTPVTQAQMKKKLGSEQIERQKISNHQHRSLRRLDEQQPQPWGMDKKVAAVVMIALLVIGFLAA